ncbi:hypothetical protein BGZ63DRAFT_385413 [Mariannaea sp. PMI_226]|nr:hypothetical protein BGZ63DRAFT_385413 [Mariannaea sp. PMI_226]
MALTLCFIYFFEKKIILPPTVSSCLPRKCTLSLTLVFTVAVAVGVLAMTLDDLAH